MCGIAGIYDPASKGAAYMERAIWRMTSVLHHRGPDDAGFHVEERLALGHKRLSIIDLDTGRQPIYNEDGTCCIVYNGEVYNFRELKNELESLGHRFKTKTDTETILHAYEEWGDECVERLRGMFAFCIADTKNKRLFLARDRLGIKPLYYTECNGRFIFASEIKAILTDPGFSPAIDYEALASYFTFSYILKPLTIFSGVRQLEPGHVLNYRNGHVNLRKYWDLEYEPDYRRSEDDTIEGFMELLRESVRMRLISDVPLGVFLSGGIDSSTLVALMSESSVGIRSFTIGFGGDTLGFDDERKYARLVAQRYATEHREFEVEPRLGGLIDKIVCSFDEPFADDATIPSFFISKLARREVKVILSGLGGDEDFCGYERYLGFHIGRLYRRLPALLREVLIKRVVESLPEVADGRIGRLKRFVRSSCNSDPVSYLGLCRKLNGKYTDDFFIGDGRVWRDALSAAYERFLKVFDSPHIEDPLNRVFYCDIKTYLPCDILACTDRISMHHSLEVRVPFLDHKLVEYCATISPAVKIKGFRKKYLLKKAVKDLLPHRVLNHRKQGFVGPLSRWFMTDLKEMVRESLSPENLERHGLLEPRTVMRLLNEHYEKRENNETIIWSLLVFQRWFELYMDGRPTVPART